MKNIKKNYIDKGTYSHSQIGGYLSLKQFILIERDGKRCLLLRFTNEADFRIDAARFILNQINAEGEEIGSVDIEYFGMNLQSGEQYSPEQGIVVKKDCVDFTVQQVSVVSGDYKYVFERGAVNACYDPRGYDNGSAKHGKRGSDKIKVRRLHRGGGKIYGVIAALSLLLVAASLVFVIYQGSYAMANDDIPPAPSTVISEKNINSINL